MTVSLKIEKYSHGARVTNFDVDTINKTLRFVETLSLKEPQRIKQRTVMTLKKKYYGLTENKRELFLHRNSINDYIEHMQNVGYPIEKFRVNEIPVPVPESATYSVNPKYVLRDYQVPIVGELSDGMYSRRLDLQTGKGKALHVDTMVRIPNGWKRMGDVKVGDLVISRDGSATSVTAVHPQGIVKLNLIVFEDGRSIRACNEHLWSIVGINRPITTKELRTLMLSGKDIYIPAVTTVRDNLVEDLQKLKLPTRTLMNKETLEVTKVTVWVEDHTMKVTVRDLLRSHGGVIKKRSDDAGFIVSAEFNNKVKIKTIFANHERAEAVCISVDHPEKLFVVENYVVTHNTFTTLAAVAEMGSREVVMIPPKYFGIWETALRETYSDATKWRLVSGSGDLKKLILDGLDGTITEDVIIISCVTYRTYIDAYEKYSEKYFDASGFMTPPPRFHDVIGAGIQINDEFQEDPGLYFRIDIFSNVKKMIYLSATPYTGNAYVTKMIDLMTPPETQCTLPEYDKYIDTLALYYSDPTVQSKDYLTPFKNTYNHARYEGLMMKSKRRLEMYFRYVRRAIAGLYVNTREPGQKALVLCATVEFIKVLTDFLQKEFPELVINYHVSGCDYEQLKKNDLTVSTIKSSGTGVDIPNLRDIILLQATGSEKDNVQIMGRGRKLKDWPDVTPRFSYFVCHNIPQHMRYMTDKQEYFKGKARNQKIARL